MVLEPLAVTGETQREDLPGGYCFIPPLLPGTESQLVGLNYITGSAGRNAKHMTCIDLCNV